MESVLVELIKKEMYYASMCEGLTELTRKVEQNGVTLATVTWYSKEHKYKILDHKGLDITNQIK